MRGRLCDSRQVWTCVSEMGIRGSFCVKMRNARCGGNAGKSATARTGRGNGWDGRHQESRRKRCMNLHLSEVDKKADRGNTATEAYSLLVGVHGRRVVKQKTRKNTRKRKGFTNKAYKSVWRRANDEEKKKRIKKV